MSLKQCRVPSTLNFCCFLTKACATSSEFAVVNFSVLYSRLPAQFLSLSLCVHDNNGAIKGLVSAAEQSLRNSLLSMKLIGRRAGTSIVRRLSVSPDGIESKAES